MTTTEKCQSQKSAPTLNQNSICSVANPNQRMTHCSTMLLNQNNGAPISSTLSANNPVSLTNSYLAAVPPNGTGNQCILHSSAQTLISNPNITQCVMHSSAQTLNQRTNINAYHQPGVFESVKAFSCNCQECVPTSEEKLKSIS